jgi:hypothetical protein
LRQLVNFARVCDGHHFRPMPLNLADQFVQIRTRRKRHNSKSPGQRLHHRQALPPDRSRGAENG